MTIGIKEQRWNQRAWYEACQVHGHPTSCFFLIKPDESNQRPLERHAGATRNYWQFTMKPWALLTILPTNTRHVPTNTGR